MKNKHTNTHTNFTKHFLEWKPNNKKMGENYITMDDVNVN